MRCNDYISIDTFFFLITFCQSVWIILSLTWPLDRGMSPRQAGWQPGWSGCCAGPGQPGFGGESLSPGNDFMSMERCPGSSCHERWCCIIVTSRWSDFKTRITNLKLFCLSGDHVYFEGLCAPLRWGRRGFCNGWPPSCRGKSGGRQR